MHKKKIAICIQDKEYEERFVRCMINHYKEQYEIHVLSSLLEIVEFQERIFTAIIAGDEEVENVISLAKKGQNVLILKEKEEIKEERQENLLYVDKYQEVYKIVENLKKLMESTPKDNRSVGKKYQMVGIFSVNGENLQLPFAAVCASIYGENHSVLLMDLQPFSGMGEDDDSEEEQLGMEDLMSVATTGVFTKNRILGAIGHEQKWDYIRPVKNTECLVEANEDIYLKMIDILAKEQEYEVIIVNFGAIFTGIFDLMGRCHKFYLLEEKGKSSLGREEAFSREMMQRGKVQFLDKITHMELPLLQGRDQEWKQTAKQWLWGMVGNQLREYIWMEKHSE